MDAAAKLYSEQMTEVRLRFNAIDRILGAKKPRLSDVKYDNEAMWLQIRKIVELVTFAGITSDEQRYAALRAEAISNPDYTDDQKVNKILPKLEAINEAFLPFPVTQPKLLKAGHWHYEHGVEDENRQRFVEIFDRAGYYLHVHNPFSPIKRAEFEQAVSESREKLLIDLAYLKGVLWHHAKVGLAFDKTSDKPTELGDPVSVWIVQFDRPKPLHVSMSIAVGIDPPVSGEAPTGDGSSPEHPPSASDH